MEQPNASSYLVRWDSSRYSTTTHHHAPIISTLQKGTVEYVNKEGKTSLEIQGGFVEVQKNKVSLCVELQ